MACFSLANTRILLTGTTGPSACAAAAPVQMKPHELFLGPRLAQWVSSAASYYPILTDLSSAGLAWVLDGMVTSRAWARLRRWRSDPRKAVPDSSSTRLARKTPGLSAHRSATPIRTARLAPGPHQCVARLAHIQYPVRRRQRTTRNSSADAALGTA
ncbi:hypothetical protein FA95DRAFT_1345244 [Auriscalpium vulgare]|uniref:Uncharacterized protein n=1 Tax=Auriscalpium vulgare TaxID=40419 RepID=A0ACB8RSS9_9AGAM|nr:hypothetical protein FA95DRAFT_1345244 [Auriscalpium vulgare]